MIVSMIISDRDSDKELYDVERVSDADSEATEPLQVYLASSTQMWAMPYRVKCRSLSRATSCH